MQNHTSHTARLLRRALTFFAIAFGLLAPAGAQVAATDSFDPAITGSNITAIAQQPDGKILLGGTFTALNNGAVSRTNLARVNADGTADTTFNANITSGSVTSIVVQPDGKILVAGGVTIGGVSRSITRLESNGSLDSSFTATGVGSVQFTRILLQPDGKILAWSISGANGVYDNITPIARLNADGSRDTSFNVSVNPASPLTTGIAFVALQPDGKVVYGCPTNVGGNARIGRINADGSFDTAFFNNLPAGLQSGSIAVGGIAIQRDGRIVFTSGHDLTASGGRNSINRLMPDGTLDTTFAGATLSSTGSSTPIGAANALSPQADGKLVVFGNLASGTHNGMTRLNADGSLDSTFAPSFLTATSTAAPLIVGFIQADGKVIGSGNTVATVNGTARFRVARLTNEAATQTLAADSASTVTWTRSGSAPDAYAVYFENSTDGGTSWTRLSGTATRVSGTGNWQLTGLSLPASGQLRATGLYGISRFGGTGGGGSSSVMQQTASYSLVTDTVRPTASIVVADTNLRIGETSLVTITFSEAVVGFTTADMFAANGTLSALSSGDGGVTWTATLTPSANATDATNVVILDNTGVADGAGNAGTGITDSNNYGVDTARPTAGIVVADTNLRIGETSLVTITFSEAVVGFTTADMFAANGTLSSLSSGDGGVTWTATLTPSANATDATNVIILDNTGVADGAGNAGTGTTDSNNYGVDTARPTAGIVVADTNLRIGETSLVTITFSEAVVGFTTADMFAANGTLSSLSSGDGGVTWTATLTPSANATDATNVIILDNTGVADGAGNAGTGTTDSNNYGVDTARPTAGIVVADTNLTVGETSLVTITFSEAVTGFTGADMSVANGSLTSLSSGDGVTWTATLTPSANITDATNVVILDNSGVADGAGNAGTGTTDSNNYAIDTALPPTNSAPTNITLSPSSIAENNAPGATVGTLTATDADAGQTHSFVLVNSLAPTLARSVGPPANDNAAFTITGNVLSINGSADFEAKSSYNIRVRATDNGAGNLTFEKNLTVTITDVTIPQTITFGSLANKSFGDAAFTVSATGGASGQPVTFGVSGPATIAGNLVSITGAGEVTVTASQAGAGDYSAAAPVQQSFTVGKAAQTITFAPAGTAQQTDSVTLTATGGASGEEVTFSLVSGPGSLAGNLLTFTADGTVIVRASQAGNANYNAAANVDRTIVVGTAGPVTTGNFFTGLLTDGTGRVRGSFLVRLTATGFGTLTVWADGKRGSTKVLGETTKVLLVGGTPLTVSFPVGPVSPSGNPTRDVTVNTGTETLAGTAIRSPYEVRNRTLSVGKYTFAATSETGAPKVAAVMSGNISQYGAVRITARLGNGRVATFNSQEQGDGKIAVYCGYGIGGAQSLAGTLARTSATAPEYTASLRWTVPAGVDARLTAGVDADYDTIGARYTAGLVGNLLALDPSKQITIGLEIPTLTPSTSSYTFPMTANLIPFLPKRPYARVLFFPATGMFSGTTAFESKQRNFYGVLLQGEALNYGVGYLQDVGALGTVSIEPQLLR